VKCQYLEPEVGRRLYRTYDQVLGQLAIMVKHAPDWTVQYPHPTTLPPCHPATLPPCHPTTQLPFQRLRIDLVQRTLDLANLPAPHVDDAIGHGGDASVVGDDGGGGAEFLVDLLEGFEHEFASAEVEGSGGFVAEEDFGAFGDRPGNSDPLLFAAGELGGKVVKAIAQTNNVQRFFGAEGAAGDFGDEGDVFASGEAGDEVVELEDEADGLAAKLGEAAIASVGQVLVAKDDLPAGGDIEATEDIQQGGFAATGRA